MWEYSINFKTENASWAKYVFSRLKDIANGFGSAVTTFEKSDYITVLVACDDFDKVRMQYAINDVIVFVITTFLKEKFLDKYLVVQIPNELSSVALKKALVNFDHDTDIHLVQKHLVLGKSIFIESFFDFRLGSLKNKWFELAKLANDNQTYLMCEETFLELLKFLIENLEVCLDSVNILFKDGTLKLFDAAMKEIQNEDSNETFDQFFISSLISLCPKNINIYSTGDDFSDSLSLLIKIFDNRVKFLPVQMFVAKN